MRFLANHQGWLKCSKYPKEFLSDKGISVKCMKLPRSYRELIFKMILYVCGKITILMPLSGSDQEFKALPDKEDKKSFDLFFKKYYPRLTAYACLFLESQAAEDEVQNLFAYLWENADDITIHTSLEAYLFKAVYQRCLNQLKQRKSRDYHHKLIGDYLMNFEEKLFDPDTNDSIRKLYMEELRNEINNAIDSLPEKCRQVFMLSYIYDLKNREISEILGVSVSTVENHVYNALKVLRQKLSKYTHLIAILFPL